MTSLRRVFTSKDGFKRSTLPDGIPFWQVISNHVNQKLKSMNNKFKIKIVCVFPNVDMSALHPLKLPATYFTLHTEVAPMTPVCAPRNLPVRNT